MFSFVFFKSTLQRILLVSVCMYTRFYIRICGALFHLTLMRWSRYSVLSYSLSLSVTHSSFSSLSYFSPLSPPFLSPCSTRSHVDQTRIFPLFAFGIYLPTATDERMGERYHLCRYKSKIRLPSPPFNYYSTSINRVTQQYIKSAIRSERETKSRFWTADIVQ